MAYARGRCRPGLAARARSPLARVCPRTGTEEQGYPTAGHWQSELKNRTSQGTPCWPFLLPGTPGWPGAGNGVRAGSYRGTVSTGCRCRSRTPPAGSPRRRRLAERVARGPPRRRPRPGRPMTGHPRSAPPGRCGTGHAGAGRDQLADDDVLLQAQQRVGLGVDGRVGEHPGRLLERGRRQPRLGGERGLGDAHEHRRGRTRACRAPPPRRGSSPRTVGRSTSSPGSSSVSPDSSTFTRLSICRMMISMCLSWIDTPCDRYTSCTSCTRCICTSREPRMRSTSCGLTAPWMSCWPTCHVVAVGDQQPGPHRHRDGDLLAAVVGDDDDLAGLLGLLDLDPCPRPR